MKSTSTHGGPRRGAGRKPTGRRAYLVRMTPTARRGLTRAAEAAGRTVPEHLDAVFGPISEHKLHSTMGETHSK